LREPKRRGRLLAVFGISVAAVVLMLAALIAAPRPDETPAWTPAPVTRAPIALTPLYTPLPTETARRAVATATPGAIGGTSNIMIISEDDIRKVLSDSRRYPEGLAVNGLDVRFTGGKVYITADNVNYGMFNLNNLALVGHLVANNGQLQIEVESVSPVGLAGAMIPRLANDAMSQLGGQVYVEDVQIGEGQVNVQFR
jgi:hypothetical protein